MEIKKTQHFSHNYKELLNGLNIPKKAVDMFAGDGIFSEISELEMYDIFPQNENIIKRDTLLNPLDYNGKYILTNPPYLAKNMTKEFDDIYKKYNTDDLYKAALLSIIGCEGGILILPINFLTDENTKDIRIKFLSEYKIGNFNYFDKPMFEKTSYSVCAFDFIKEKNEKQEIKIDGIINELELKYGYRFGGKWYNKFNNVKNIFGRVLKDDSKKTNIFLYALDTRENKIRLEYNEKCYYGKDTDRVFATLTCENKLSELEELFLIKKFNSFLNGSREKYSNLLLTNYRDYGRKRISFDLVYKMCSYLYGNMVESG